MRTALGAAFAAALSAIAPAMADDWTAQQLRGQVLQLVANQWQPLGRGDVVPDDRVIRTLGFGRVTFVRGDETIELGPNTQIQIHDRAGSKPFTTVTQYFGTVGVEAEVQNVQHFAVDTPFLAAVVKGTKFVVISGKTGAKVSVNRGHVAVNDRHSGEHVTISVGQSATVDGAKGGSGLSVSGSGVLPVVLDKSGKPVDDAPEIEQATVTIGGVTLSPPNDTRTALMQPEDASDKADKSGDGDKPGKGDKSGKGDKGEKSGKGDDDGDGSNGNGKGNSGNGNGNGGGDGSNGNSGNGNSGHGRGHGSDHD